MLLELTMKMIRSPTSGPAAIVSIVLLPIILNWGICLVLKLMTMLMELITGLAVVPNGSLV